MPHLRLLVPLALAALLAVAGSAPAARAATLTTDPLDALPTAYAISASLSYTYGTIRAVETATVRNAGAAPVGVLHFSVLARAYGEMTVSAVSVNGVAVTPSYPNSADLRVSLPAPLAPGASAVVRIAFRDVASSSITDSLRARLSKAYGIMQVADWHPVLSDGHGLRYPGDSQHSAASPYTVRITAPLGLRFAVPGSYSRATTSTSQTLSVSLPAARSFAFAVSPYYVSASAYAARPAADGAPIRVTVFAKSASAASTALNYSVSALDRLAATYGAYPYHRYVVAQSPRYNSGNEYSGEVFIGSSYLTSRAVVTHETAHQWFYGLVGNDQLRAPWIDEGFAEFAGRTAIGASLPGYCSSLRVDTSVYYWPNSPATNVCGGYNQTVYAKTASMLGHLRSLMGTTRFWTAMRTLVAQGRGRIVGEAEIIDVFASAAADPAAVRSLLVPAFLSGS